jgi:dihydrofolate reductase
MNLPRRIEGYAIVSADGMIADAEGVMPDSLRIDADQRYFARGLEGVDVVAHGRHSREHQPGSHFRRRLILTRRIPGLAPDPSDPSAVLWNPAGASFEEAWTALGVTDGALAIIGGPEVFGMFLPDYDLFHLSRIGNLRLPGGRPVFPAVPACAPEEVLRSHGLKPSAPQVLDAEKGVTVVTWHR